MVHPSSLHESGKTRIIPFDLSEELQIPYPCTSPNLLSSFIRICDREIINTIGIIIIIII
jgi:hypothetical protein